MHSKLAVAAQGAMIPPRKTQRVGPRLVGLPYEPDEAAVAVIDEPEPAPPKRRRGRPPTGNAKTPAQRKQAQRERPEKRKLWKAIEKRIRRSENPDKFGGLCNKEGCDDSRHKHVRNVAASLPAMKEDFMRLSIEKARLVAETYEKTWDSTGRLSIEGHTGTKEKQTNSQRLEKISGAMQTREMYGGGKRKNLGAGADSDDADVTAPNDRRIFNRITISDLCDMRDYAAKFDTASNELLDGEENEPIADTEKVESKPIQCVVCDQTFEFRAQGRVHIDEEYDREMKQLKLYNLAREAAASNPTYQTMVTHMESWFKTHRHAWFVQQIVGDLS
jgi:hypothetical protein